MSDPANPPRRAAVLTVSDRVARQERADLSGPLAVKLLISQGFEVADAVVVPDDQDAVSAAITDLVASGVDVVVTTGGTGLGPRDVTPEATRRVLDREAPGISELIRRRGGDTVPTAALSRAAAGISGQTLIVNLAGSTGAVKDGIEVLAALLPHAVDQLRGGDH